MVRAVVLAATVLAATALAGAADAGALGTSATGTTWIVQASPNVGQFTHLLSVSCPTPTTCLAVGNSLASPSNNANLALDYDGVSWAISPSPTLGASVDNRLDAVSCWSATNCTAVGEVNGTAEILLMHFDGTSWTRVASSQAGELEGVSCTGPSTCLAVGNDGTASLVMEESASGWSRVPSPSPPDSTMLSGVSCVSATSCEMVGSIINANPSPTSSATRTLAMGFNGTSVTLQTTPDQTVQGFNDLQAVSCPSPTSCVAVGFWDNTVVGDVLALTYDGTTWSESAAVSPPGVEAGLEGVACASTTSCTAVGSDVVTTPNVDFASQATLAETFDGSGWALSATPSPGQDHAPLSVDGSLLKAVSCPSPSRCVAVGTTTTSPPQTEGLDTGLVLATVPTPTQGYWMTSAGGGVFTLGSALFFGSLPAVGVTPAAPVVAMAATPDARGYWLAGTDGGVFAFGDARFAGSPVSEGVAHQPIVGIAGDATDDGYLLAASDGGVDAFGTASYAGSLPGLGVAVDDVVGIAPTPDGRGYWLVAADGGVFAFGDAHFAGSAPALGVAVDDVVGITPTPDGRGYWLLGADGGVFAFGDARYFGGATNSGGGAAVALVSTADGAGYWILTASGVAVRTGDAPDYGYWPGPYGGPLVAAAGTA